MAVSVCESLGCAVVTAGHQCGPAVHFPSGQKLTPCSGELENKCALGPHVLTVWT